MTGGGFGGAAIALAPREAIEQIAAAVRAAFASRDYSEPATFTVTAADGARRLR